MTKIIDLIIYIFIFENWITFASGKCTAWLWLPVHVIAKLGNGTKKNGS